MFWQAFILSKDRIMTYLFVQDQEKNNLITWFINISNFLFLDYSKGFGGKYGVSKDSQDKVSKNIIVSKNWTQQKKVVGAIIFLILLL